MPFTQDNDIDLNTLKDQIEQEGNELNQTFQKDDFSEATGTVPGTPENKAQQELAEEAANINSTGRINTTLKLMKAGGYIGLFVGFTAKIVSLVFDLNYHLSDIVSFLGDFLTGIIAGFIVLLFMLLFHLAGKGLINNKWEKTPKRFWTVIFILIGFAFLYIDYRAIDNYSTKTVENAKSTKMNNKNNHIGSQNDLISTKKDIIQKNIQTYRDSLNSVQNLITNNQEMIKQANESIEKVKEKKLNKISKKRVRQLNQNIYTSRKQLKQLNQNAQDLDQKLQESRKNLDAEIAKLEELENDKQSLIHSADGEMAEEKAKRVGFFIVLIFIIEFISNLGLIAEFLNVKNIKKEEIIKLMQDKQSHKDIFSAVKHTLDRSIANDIVQFSQEGEYRLYMEKLQNFQKLAQMNSQIQNTKGNIKLLTQFGQVVDKVNEEAVKSVGYQIGAIKANRENEALKKLIAELEKD